MRIDRRALDWGVFLIVVGAVSLAVQQGWIPRDVEWWRFWPVLLIGWGVGLIVGRTAAGAIGGLIVAVTLGLLVGGVIAGGLSLGRIGAVCAGETGGVAFPAQSGTFTGSAAAVTLDTGCGGLTVTTAAGTGWSLAGTSSDGQPPRIEASGQRLEIRSRDEGGFRFVPFDAGEHWDVRLPTGVTLNLAAEVNAGTARLSLGGATLGELDLSVNAGDGRLDLEGAAISRLSASVNAGDIRVVLPNANVSGSLSVNAGSIGFCAPAGAGLRVTMGDNITASNNFEAKGLTRTGDSWETAGYASAIVKIDLSASANAGSVALDPEGGCR
jgi:hypothetical protein